MLGEKINVNPAIRFLLLGILLTSTLSFSFRRTDGRPGQLDRTSEASRLNLIGIAHLEENEYQAGARAFALALDIFPDFCPGILNLGIAHYYNRDFSEARRCFQRVLLLQGGDLNAHFMLSLLALREKKIDEAELHLEQVRRADPSDSGVNYNLGLMSAWRAQYLESAVFFRRTLQSEPQHAGAIYRLAIALARIGMHEEAENWMAKFKQIKRTIASGHGMGDMEPQYGEEGLYACAVIICSQ